MRKTVFGALVIGLAGTCWIVARNAEAQTAPRSASPYLVQPVAPPRATTMEPPVEPVVIPPIQLEVEQPTAPAPALNPISIPVAPEPPRVPVIDPPAPRAVPAIPTPEPIRAPVEPPIAPAPIVVPAPLPPSLPPVEARQPTRAPIRPALTAIPGLPPVPGVAADYANAAPDMPNVPVVEPIPGGATQPPVRSWSVDAPTVVPDGQSVFNEPLTDSSARVLGPRVWGGAEYLMWYVQRDKSPVLARFINGVRQGDSNFEGWQVQDLYPDDSTKPLSGGGLRGTIGFWLNERQTVGFEANYFWLDNWTRQDQFQSTSSSVLVRPFVAPNGQDLFFQMSNVYGAVGTMVITQQFHADGGEANFLVNSFGLGQSLNLIAGFRFFQTHERLEIASQILNENEYFLGRSLDSFGTSNQFYGGQVGLKWNYEGRRLFASVTGKVAFGTMQEKAKVNGGTYVYDYGREAVAPGGVLALPTNMGSYSRSTTAWLPEANVTLGYNVTPWAAAFVGYNFMWVSNVARPGAQIDTVIDPGNFPFRTGATYPRPGFVFKEDSLWLQGINFGLALRF